MKHNSPFNGVRLGVLTVALCLIPTMSAFAQLLDHDACAAIIHQPTVPLESPRDSANVFADIPHTSVAPTSIHLDLAQSEHLRVSVCEPLGKEVWHHHLYLAAGSQELAFDGRALPPGIYYCKIRSEHRRWATMMTVER